MLCGLRRGRLTGIRVERLLRLILSQGYHMSIRFDEIPRRFAPPRKAPTVTVARYNLFGRLCELPDDIGRLWHRGPRTREASG